MSFSIFVEIPEKNNISNKVQTHVPLISSFYPPLPLHKVYNAVNNPTFGIFNIIFYNSEIFVYTNIVHEFFQIQDARHM